MGFPPLEGSEPSVARRTQGNSIGSFSIAVPFFQAWRDLHYDSKPDGGVCSTKPLLVLGEDRGAWMS